MFGINKWLVVLVVGGALIALASYKAFYMGVDSANAEWVVATQKQQGKHDKKVKDLTEEYRASLSLYHVQIGNIADNLHEVQNEITNINGASNRLYADIERLFFDASSKRTDSNQEEPLTISTRECNGETITELSGVVSRAIHDKFGECDQIVNQLTACQAVVVEQQLYCNK